MKNTELKTNVKKTDLNLQTLKVWVENKISQTYKHFNVPPLATAVQECSHEGTIQSRQ